MYVVRTLIIEILSLSFTIAAAVVMRWLLCLSTPEQDWYWVKTSGLWDYLYSLKWYRGTEYLHQLRFSKIVDVNTAIIIEEDEKGE